MLDSSASGSAPAFATRSQPLPGHDKRRATREIETQADADGGGWLVFDLGRALHLLHSKDGLVSRRTLRRLHVCFWHRLASRLNELLRKAGAPETVTNIVHGMFETCRICSMWTPPSVRIMTRTSLATGFNQVVRWDILLYRHVMLSYMMCKATRRTSFAVLATKDVATILECMVTQ